MRQRSQLPSPRARRLHPSGKLVPVLRRPVPGGVPDGDASGDPPVAPTGVFEGDGTS